MEDNNQRIIFLVPEETTPAEIILKILEKNGIKDPGDDLTKKDKTPRLVIVYNTTKDFFEKKIIEEKMSELFQKELKVSKENAIGIISDIKQKLIPFAKKITVPADGEQIKAPENPTTTDEIEFPTKTEKTTESLKNKEDIKIPVSTKSKIRKTTEIKKDLKPNVSQNKGPDSYREPIE